MNAHLIQRDVDLRPFSSFRLAARAHELILLESLEQLDALPRDDQPLLVLGGGSNTVFLGDWPGRILVNRLRGIDVERLDDARSRVRVGAGENWHRLVRWCIDQGLHGLENLIMIPGSVGAAPMQNIGAYGVELGSVLESVRAWDWQEGRTVQISCDDCGLGYRDSRFKSTDHGRFLITGIDLVLRHRYRPVTDYQSLGDALARRRLDQPSARELAASVMRLRRHRLPDPARLPNAGSFFKNPIVADAAALALLEDFPALPHWPQPNGMIKLAAGWMIDRLGFRGHRIGDAGVYHRHALVLVNHGRATTGDLERLIEEISDAVFTEFGLRLEPEPLLLRAARTD